MKIGTLIGGLTLPAAFFVSATMAHHGASEYDLNTVREYEGVVAEHLWKNPHNLIVLETQSESGEPLRLEIEGGGPSVLQTLGVTSDSIVVGERVTAVVSPSRRFPNRFASGLEIVKGDGNVVPLGPNSSSARIRQTRETASSIFGTWTAPMEAFRGLIRSRASWVLTEEGQRAFDSYSPVMSSQTQCIPVGAPWLMVHVAVHEIEQAEDRIIIRTDWLGGVERTIYLDGREHPPTTERFQQGYSVGRWEDGVLIVETTNFADGVYAGVASSGQKRLIERWSLSDGGNALNYSFVLDDPVYLAEQVSGTYRWDYHPELEPSGIECDLASAERYLREFQ